VIYVGTDIHAQVEIKVNGKWQWLLSGLNEYASADGLNPADFDRSYNLFALCGVRNGTGFAGCKTGEGFNPISEPKGLPTDLPPELRAMKEEHWIFGDHSQSYVTEAELNAYDWDQETTEQGVVSVEEFKVFKSKGKPDGWCGGVHGVGVECISNEEMERHSASELVVSGGIT
jgi:hypothetical protein